MSSGLGRAPPRLLGDGAVTVPVPVAEAGGGPGTRGVCAAGRPRQRLPLSVIRPTRRRRPGPGALVNPEVGRRLGPWPASDRDSRTRSSRLAGCHFRTASAGQARTRTRRTRPSFEPGTRGDRLVQWDTDSASERHPQLERPMVSHARTHAYTHTRARSRARTIRTPDSFLLLLPPFLKRAREHSRPL